jgi:hypothetical protein
VAGTSGDGRAQVVEPQTAIGHQVVEALDDIGLRQDRELGQWRALQAGVVLQVPGRVPDGVLAQPLQLLVPPRDRGRLRKAVDGGARPEDPTQPEREAGSLEPRRHSGGVRS